MNTYIYIYITTLFFIPIVLRYYFSISITYPLPLSNSPLYTLECACMLTYMNTHTRTDTPGNKESMCHLFLCIWIMLTNKIISKTVFQLLT